MSLTADALTETQLAFDAAAAIYDAENAENPVLCEMRRRTVAAITERLPAGSTLLDLGCGPGPDAEHLGRNGYRVLAIDWSPEMAREAERRVRSAGLEARVDVRHLGIHELDQLGGRTFDGAYSNLGPLNCVPELATTARMIATRLSAGGIFVASVIGRGLPLGARALRSRSRLETCPGSILPRLRSGPLQRAHDLDALLCPGGVRDGVRARRIHDAFAALARYSRAASVPFRFCPAASEVDRAAAAARGSRGFLPGDPSVGRPLSHRDAETIMSFLSRLYARTGPRPLRLSTSRRFARRWERRSKSPRGSSRSSPSTRTANRDPFPRSHN